MEDKTQGQLAGIQAAGLFVSLGMALVGGTITGCLSPYSRRNFFLRLNT